MWLLKKVGKKQKVGKSEMGKFPFDLERTNRTSSEVGKFRCSWKVLAEWWDSDIIPRFTKILEFLQNFWAIVLSIKNNSLSQNFSP